MLYSQPWHKNLLVRLNSEKPTLYCKYEGGWWDGQFREVQNGAGQFCHSKIILIWSAFQCPSHFQFLLRCCCWLQNHLAYHTFLLIFSQNQRLRRPMMRLQDTFLLKKGLKKDQFLWGDFFREWKSWDLSFRWSWDQDREKYFGFSRCRFKFNEKKLQAFPSRLNRHENVTFLFFG